MTEGVYAVPLDRRASPLILEEDQTLARTPSHHGGCNPKPWHYHECGCVTPTWQPIFPPKAVLGDLMGGLWYVSRSQTRIDRIDICSAPRPKMGERDKGSSHLNPATVHARSISVSRTSYILTAIHPSRTTDDNKHNHTLPRRLLPPYTSPHRLLRPLWRRQLVAHLRSLPGVLRPALLPAPRAGHPVQVSPHDPPAHRWVSRGRRLRSEARKCVRFRLRYRARELVSGLECDSAECAIS